MRQSTPNITISQFSVHSSGVQTEQCPFPIRFDRTFHKSLFMKREEEKNPACPHGATVLILLVTVTYSPAPILQAPN